MTTPQQRLRHPVGCTLEDRIAAADLIAKQQEAHPVAWMHDVGGRVDVIHDKVKTLWLRAGQSDGFYREKVPCRVEHYTIPLYTSPQPNHGAQAAMKLALSTLHFMNDNSYRLEEYEQAIAALEKEIVCAEIEQREAS